MNLLNYFSFKGFSAQSGGTELKSQLLGRLRQETHELMACLGGLTNEFKAKKNNSVRPCLRVKRRKQAGNLTRWEVVHLLSARPYVQFPRATTKKKGDFIIRLFKFLYFLL